VTAAAETPGGSPGLADLDVVEELASYRRRDPNRPEYHFMPPAHWMNEPHGAIQIGEVHHVFYQANRRGPFWGGIEWGHATSNDLVHWTHLPPALRPDQVEVAPDGIWSGSSVLDDSGEPLLFFTAGDFGRSPDQAVAVARPVGDSWVADEKLLIELPVEVGGHELMAGQFRDPFVWREESGWFMLVGAGVRYQGGTAVLYRSDDGANWGEAAGLVLIGDRQQHPEVGEMWELPVLLPIKDEQGGQRHVLLVCPWWQRVPAGRVVEVLYWVGRWDAEAATFVSDHDEPRRFDYGRHFTGPSGNVLADGRTILWSITQDGRTPEVQSRWAWAHNAGLPLELSLAPSGDLAISPLRELAVLRDELLAESPQPVSGTTLELELHAVLPDTEELRVRLLDPAGGLLAEIRVDARSLGVSRPGAASYDSWMPEVEASGLVLLTDGVCRLRVFVDHSMVEAYLNESRSLTTRIDVSAGPPVLEPVVGPDTRITSCRVWRLSH
jgi:sucrose-6-phosphate hydrolase SacC (GH32 family)